MSFRSRRSRVTSASLAAGGGFLLGVLWMDLLFDVQALGTPSEAALASIAAYYRRAVVEAYPMNRMIATVMLLTVAGSLYQLAAGSVPRKLALPASAFALIAVGLAIFRIVPNAARLGSGAAAAVEQLAMARAICIDHFVCLALMAAFVAAQIAATRASQPMIR